jgi:hypothetical protein
MAAKKLVDENGQPITDDGADAQSAPMQALQSYADPTPSPAGFQGSGPSALRPNVGQRLPPSLAALLSTTQY